MRRLRIAATAGAAMALAGGVTAAIAAPGGGHAGGGGEGEETAANNLSYPLVWGEGPGLTLPGTAGAPVFSSNPADTDLTDVDGDGTPAETVWLQQHPANSWQAGTFDASSAPLNLTSVDWGDNLEAKAWSTNRRVRVETSLHAALGQGGLPASLTGFSMFKVGTATGPSEMWGTDKSTYAGTDALVYSKCARLTIQRLKVARTDPALSKLAWYPKDGKWIGDNVTEPKVKLATNDATGGYGAELNIQGKVVYGYNWQTLGYYGGDYRITFSLDGTACPGTSSNTHITSDTTIVPSSEGEAAVAAEDGGSGGGGAGGGVAQIDGKNNLSYIDVTLTGPTAPDEPGALPSDLPPTTPPTTPQPTTPTSTGNPNTPLSEPTPKRCTARLQFRLRLKDYLSWASAAKMNRVRKTIVAVDGQLVRAHRGTDGITAEIDLRKAKRTRARVRIELHLNKPVLVARKDGKVRTRQLTRTLSFPTCAAGS